MAAYYNENDPYAAAWRPLGNAVVPQVAAELIRAFLDCQP